MRSLLLNFAKIRLIKEFEFLKQLGYEMVKSDMVDDERLVITYKNDNTKKDIDFSISDCEDVRKFFINISIVRNPYLTVNDFVSFDTYLQKNNISVMSNLKGNQIREYEIEKYIHDYATLFSKHGIPLIKSEEQFAGYYPQWT
jgi:hypothetical protein